MSQLNLSDYSPDPALDGTLVRVFNALPDHTNRTHPLSVSYAGIKAVDRETRKLREGADEFLNHAADSMRGLLGMWKDALKLSPKQITATPQNIVQISKISRTPKFFL